ncbi:hypothetical protein [Bacillus zhangzhouensis]|uniref:hypothetical protein n=1 Tax=Bacillus zhangzhouensis TaxID=1178540 RepID=UPI003D1B060D
MKPFVVSYTCLIMISCLTSCQKPFSGEYIEYGEVLGGSGTIKLLEQHEIPYRVREGVLYIPEDAVEQAVSCCS